MDSLRVYARLIHSGVGVSMGFDVYLTQCPGDGEYTVALLCGDDVELYANGHTPKEAYDKFMVAFDVRYGDIHH